MKGHRQNSPRISLSAWVIVLALASCRPNDTAVVPNQPSEPRAHDEAWFVEVTREWGIDFVNDAGPLDTYFMPQITGTGAAIFDMDQDGMLDLYFLQGAGPQSNSANQLYRQRKPGDFENVSQASGLDLRERCTGVAVGDMDNDGLPDVCVTLYGGVRLLRNQGAGKFRDITPESGIVNPLWATSATFFDYDRDGRLDLFVTNYLDYDPTWPCKALNEEPDYCSPEVFSGTVSKLFRNRAGKARNAADDKASEFRFEDMTIEAGIAAGEGPGLGVVAADFTGDAWPDLLVANDAKPNRLWVNRQNGTFVDEGILRGVAVNFRGEAQGNMGIAFNDADGDSLLDLFVTHLGRETHTLWRQSPRGFFQDTTVAAGIGRVEMRATGFGTAMEDFDHDGDVDLAIVNGRIGKGPRLGETELGPHFSQYAERNHLWANDGQGNFRNVSSASAAFCDQPGVYRGLACGDLDGDGALDLVVTAVGRPARVFRNVAGKRGHWLMIRVIDPELRRDAFGAEVTVRAGDRAWIRRVQSDGSFECANASAVHVGLGDRDKVDAIEVKWPDGELEQFPGVTTGQIIVVRRGEGKILSDSS